MGETVRYGKSRRLNRPNCQGLIERPYYSRACLSIVTISPPPGLDTTDYDDLPVSVGETPSTSEAAQAYRRLSRSIDSYLASTMGSDVGVNTVHRIQSRGQEELAEMTGARRRKWLRGAWKTAFRLASG